MRIFNLFKMEKIESKILTLRIAIRPAKSIDFFYEKTEMVNKKPVVTKTRKIGMSYFLTNTKGDTEAYTLVENSNSDEINKFIAAKKCFVVASVGYVDFDAKIIEQEFYYIDKSVVVK